MKVPNASDGATAFHEQAEGLQVADPLRIIRQAVTRDQPDLPRLLPHEELLQGAGLNEGADDVQLTRVLLARTHELPVPVAVDKAKAHSLTR